MQVSMKEYIKESIEEIPEKLGDPYSSPAVDQLFKVNKQGVSLDEKKAQQFHTTVPRMLCVCKRPRPNIHPT
eukprot:10994452-Ditylum_brightwellii.AAC.1